jgi:hypothetical protein
MEAVGKAVGAVREESVPAVVVRRRFGTEVDEAADLRLADGQPVDTRLLGERPDGLQVGGLDGSAVAGHGLGTRVVAVPVTVGRVVRGDLVDVGQHVHVPGAVDRARGGAGAAVRGPVARRRAPGGCARAPTRSLMPRAYGMLRSA